MNAPPPPVRPRTLSALAGALFLLSGAAGLLYEVLWARQFAHHLGGSYPAVVAVVAAFLTGLAAGAALGGRWATRLRRPLRAYGLLEIGVGVYGLLFPLLLGAAGPLLGACFRALSGVPAVHAAARFLVAFALLLPPTVAMGATLPVLVRFVVEGGVRVVGGTGLLYGLNTVGAAGGAVVTGFALLPALGLRGTLLSGVAVNLLVGIGAALADRRLGRDLPVAPAGGPGPLPADHPDAPSPATRRALLLLAGGSGAAAMLYQLSWTKSLLLAFGSSVHAFTLVVAAFILGLGVGGLLAPLVRARGRRLVLALAGLEAAVAVAAWAGIHEVAALPLAVIEEAGAFLGDYDGLLLWQAGRALRLVLLPTLGMGAAFPALVAALAGDASRAPRAVGRVYGWNTAGTLLGSLGGGMVLIPAAGLGGALLAGALLHLGLAAAAAATVLPAVRARAVVGGALLAGAALAAGAPRVPSERLNCGPYLYGATYLAEARKEGRALARVLRDYEWDTPFFRTGRSATVGVVRRPAGGAYLRINGKTDAGTGDLATQVLLGQMPALARPEARNALVVGLATGISAAALASHGVERLDLVDISPEVVEASRYFDPLNGGVLDHPGTRVLVEDGRTVVEQSRATWDIIVTEPTNPWIAGVSNLFTVEYFRACRERLSEDGVLCVWLQAYGVSLEDFRMVVRTVREVFPGTTVWESGPYVDFVLLAPRDDDADLVERIASRPPPSGAAAANLALGGIASREALLATLAMDRAATASFAGEGPLHTDDRLQLEFRAPRGTFGDAGYPVMRAEDMDRFRDPSPVLAHAGADRAALERALEARRRAFEGLAVFRRAADPAFRARFRETLAAEPERLAALAARMPADARARVEDLDPGAGGTGIDDAALTQLLWARTLELLEGAGEVAPGDRRLASVVAECRLARGLESLRTGRLGDAEADLLEARARQPDNAAIPLWIARVHRRAAAGDPASPRLARALEAYGNALAVNSRYETALVEKAEVLVETGREVEAEALLLSLLEMRPDSVRALLDRADLLRRRGRAEEARALLDRARDLEPGHPALAQPR